MNVPLTAGRAKETLSHAAPEHRLELRLFQVITRLLDEVRLPGIGLQRITIPAPYGKIALPSRFSGIEGIATNGRVIEQAGIMWRFLPGKYSTDDFSDSDLHDLGFSPVMNDLPVGGVIVVSGTTDEVVKVWGEDSAGLAKMLVFEGPDSISNTLVNITRISKEEATASVSVTHVAADTTVTTLAILDTFERESQFRRYFVGALSGTALNTAVALVKVQAREITSEDQLLEISNLDALEAGLRAKQAEAEADITLATTYWNTARDILRKDLSAAKAASELPSIRFISVGGSPKLTSFM